MARDREFDERTQGITDEMFDKIAGKLPEAATTESDDSETPKEEKVSKKAVKPARPFPHGAKHRQAVELVDKNKTYTLEEAVTTIKKTSYTKFDGAVDVHVRLNPAKKSDEAVRGTVTLPHGTGRDRRVIIITDELIEKIEKGWLDFDVAVATPDMMPKLAKLAKVLGPKGLMPNPKSGTVTTDPAKAAEELKGGRVEFKADSLGNIHQSIGKISWDDAKLAENFQIFTAALPKSRVNSVSIAPTMGPGVKVQI